MLTLTLQKPELVEKYGLEPRHDLSVCAMKRRLAAMKRRSRSWAGKRRPALSFFRDMLEHLFRPGRKGINGFDAPAFADQGDLSEGFIAVRIVQQPGFVH